MVYEPRHALPYVPGQKDKLYDFIDKFYTRKKNLVAIMTDSEFGFFAGYVNDITIDNYGSSMGATIYGGYVTDL